MAARACTSAACWGSDDVGAVSDCHGNIGSQPFPGQGIARVIYFTILVSHIVLAVTILPLALTTTARGLMSRYDRHVRIARWTLPLGLYVSVTGVVMYSMLYQMY